MAKTQTYNTRWRLNYTQTEKDSGDTAADIDFTFENPVDEYRIASNLDTFLKASGFENIEVKVK